MIETPNANTCEDVAKFLSLDIQHTLKSLIYKSVIGDEEEFIFVALLGDDKINEIKLKNYIGADHIVMATDNELLKLNLVKGYMGPVNLGDMRVIFDDQIRLNDSYIIGGNRDGYHQDNFSISKFYKEPELTSLRMSQEGDLDGSGNQIKTCRGIEVGHIFQLGDKYTKAIEGLFWIKTKRRCIQ